MDASAIQYITEMSDIDRINNYLSGKGAIALPKSATLESLERFDGTPDFFRARYKTTVLDEYITYINQNADKDSGIFIDPDLMQSTAIIDLGSHSDPQWGHHIAHALLKKTPAYNALLNADNTSNDQQKLIDWLEDWEAHIHFHDADHQGLDFKQTIRTLRRVKVNANASATNDVSNFAASRSTLEQIEIKAGSEELPAGFVFECEPYEGFSSYRFACQLRAVPSEKTAMFKYRIGQLEAQEVAIADEFKQMIKNRVTVADIKIYLGKMAYQS